MTPHPVLSSREIRRLFLDYFATCQHHLVARSSLVPSNDPTLLFTNAGMVQFKDVFLGFEKRSYQRAASAQLCLRVGGKHNDLEQVGYTARHHTCFEMLGNFSFGDYFKKEAIRFAWTFLTEQLCLPKERLLITVFKDDQEAEALWLNDIKISREQLIRCDEKDNFWSMGPTGPCGPCTEIYYDHGPGVPGGLPGTEDSDGDRYIEIWNLVFMQYNRTAEGALVPLPKTAVDTGMGLERITAIMQGVKNNYDSDLFQPIIQRVFHLSPKTLLLPTSSSDMTSLQKEPEALFSLRVIADHIRACSFLITDGVLPSNEGRGYVLRRIIRRALRHGHKLGLATPFFYRLVKPVIDVMQDAYPELLREQQSIETVLKQEEQQFSTTLLQGLKIFEQIAQQLSTMILPGSQIFSLYDTYGFPADLTADMAKERHLIMDWEGFEDEMAKQRARSKQSSQFKTTYAVSAEAYEATRFTGYERQAMLDHAAIPRSTILSLSVHEKAVTHLKAGDKASIILDSTPFYAESGGQVGDQGVLCTEQATFKVLDTIKHAGAHVHVGYVEKGSFAVGDHVIASVDMVLRAATVLNHTATHLLHHALQKILGQQATQKGSLVSRERLRFDFVQAAPLTRETLSEIERQVNAEIRANYPADVREMSLDQALQCGAMSLFNEKYGSEVRVVQFGPSIELCGGTHVERTGDIGLFKITSETGIAANIRRIEAVTGNAALFYLEQREIELKKSLEDAKKEISELNKKLEYYANRLAIMTADQLCKQSMMVGAIAVLAVCLNESHEGIVLRDLLDALKQRLQTAVIVLATINHGKARFMVGVSSNLISQYRANDIAHDLASSISGKGGGRADFAEAGGVCSVTQVEAALQSVYERISISSL